MEADNQAIQIILMGLLEDIYAGVDSCDTTQEIWLHVEHMMKGSNIRAQEKKAKLFNEWEKFKSIKGESTESYYHRFSKLMNDFSKNKHFLEKIASNLKFLNNLQPEWNRYVTTVLQTKDLYEVDYTQLYDFLKMHQEEVNKVRAERLARTHDPLALMENSQNPYNYLVLHPNHPSQITYMQHPPPNNNYDPQPTFNTNVMQQPMQNPDEITDPTTAINMALILMAKAFKLNYSIPTNNNQRISSNPRNMQITQTGMNMGQDRKMQMNGLIVVPGISTQNRNGNVVAARAEEDIDEIEKVNANCILMANLQQASTSGTQTDSAPVYDSDGSAEVHKYKSASKFVRDFKSLAKEADKSLDSIKRLENENDRLLRAVVNTLDPLSQKLDDENVSLEFQVMPLEKENKHLKSIYQNLFDSIKQTRAQTKIKTDSLPEKLHDTIYENAKLREQLHGNITERNNAMRGTSVNTKFAKPLTSRIKLYSVTSFPKTQFIPKVRSHHQNFGEAGVSKDISGSELLAPSYCSGIKGQSDKGDEGLSSGGTKLNSILITAERMEEAQGPAMEGRITPSPKYKHLNPKERPSKAGKKVKGKGKDELLEKSPESKPSEKVVIHDDYPDQTIIIGGNLSAE
ncbi:hypothetical protein Tco_0134552 [Tanacetum coccineum]